MCLPYQEMLAISNTGSTNVNCYLSFNYFKTLKLLLNILPSKPFYQHTGEKTQKYCRMTAKLEV